MARYPTWGQAGHCFDGSDTSCALWWGRAGFKVRRQVCREPVCLCRDVRGCDRQEAGPLPGDPAQGPPLPATPICPHHRYENRLATRKTCRFHETGFWHTHDGMKCDYPFKVLRLSLVKRGGTLWGNRPGTCVCVLNIHIHEYPSIKFSISS